MLRSLGRAGSGAVTLVSAIALCSGCASSAPRETSGPPAPTPRPQVQVTVDSELAAPAQGSWVAYAMAKSVELDAPRLPNGEPDRFGVEVEARRALASIWRELDEPAGTDPYLDALVEVERRGFLEEYAFTYFAEPGWTISPALMGKLELVEFFEWAVENLGSHRAETRAVISGAGDPAPLPGAGLRTPAGVVDDGRVDCATPSDLYAAADRWAEASVRVPGQALAAADSLEILATLRRTGIAGELGERGVTWVPAELAELSYVAGYCAIEQRDYERAIGYLESAVSLRPTDASARLELVQAQVFLKRFEDALSQVDTVLGSSKDPCNIALALRKRGYVEFEQGKLREAYATYRESQKYEPESPIARSELEVLFDMMQRSGFEDLPPRDFTAPPSIQAANACTL